jgi:acetyl esterase/lipase
MWIKIWMIRNYIYKIDKKRNDQIPEIKGLVEQKDIKYEKGCGRFHRLDVFRPTNAVGKIPTIVIVHGGGWVYGDKEIYRLYARDLARRGFAVLSYNYVLAPRKRFPYQLIELDHVLEWAKAHEEEYGLDTKNLFLVGDSAGAQLSVQYTIAATNPEYGKLFKMSYPIVPKGLSLGCGTYQALGHPMADPQSGLIWQAYLGKHFDPKDPRYDYLPFMTPKFPACYVMTAEKDFIKADNPLLLDVLKKNNIPYAYKEYTSKEGDKLQHVFFINVIEPHAVLANNEQCAYLKKLVK